MDAAFYMEIGTCFVGNEVTQDTKPTDTHTAMTETERQMTRDIELLWTMDDQSPLTLTQFDFSI